MKETFEQLVARVRASSYFVWDEGFERELRKRKRPTRADRILRRAEQLARSQLDLLVEVLEHGQKLVTIGGELYRVGRSDTGYLVEALEAARKYEVAADLSACTCPDFKFRGGPCKHVAALKGGA